MLNKSNILVLDEPAANGDTQTGQRLQEDVNESFPGAAIISIAHRLDTIFENDKTIVLGNGRLLEFGSLADLLSGKSGESHFASLLDDTGVKIARELRNRSMKAKENEVGRMMTHVTYFPCAGRHSVNH